MIREALEYLFLNNAKRVEPIRILADDPRTDRFVIDGKITTIQREPRPRSHAPRSLDDFAETVLKFGDEAEVFFNESSVSARLDGDGQRVDSAVFTLETSDAWNKLSELDEWMTQKDFVRLLRIDFGACLHSGVLLDKVRKLKFENGQTVTSEISRRKESLGKSITAEVPGETDLPEVVTLNIAVYKSLGERERYSIQCSVEIDPMKLDCFRLLPMPDEMERVQHLAMDSIRARLAESLPGVPAFYGHP